MAGLVELVQKLKQPNKSEAVKLLMEGQQDWQLRAYSTGESTVREAQDASVQQLADYMPAREDYPNEFEVITGSNLALVYNKVDIRSNRLCFVTMKAPGKKDIPLTPVRLWRKGDRWVVW